MKYKNRHRVMAITPDSIAEELEIESGDVLLSINGQEIEDVFDYKWLINNENIILEIARRSGEVWEIEIEKYNDEDLGLVFENELMSHYKSCHNDCTFCFVSQMPEGMRDTLYFKDDDYRLSFLQGNYITLTNLTDSDIERIIKYRLEPLNISIQTMNKTLRNKMLNNKHAGESLEIMEKLYDAGISMNAQVVLCKNYNDGKELEFTIAELERYIPILKSLTIVPVGLSKHREGLTKFEAFTKEDAIEITDLVERVQDTMYKKHGIHYIYASDEWYALARKKVPDAIRYDGFEELENGVGMLRLLQDEVDDALSSINDGLKEVKNSISIITGEMAFPYIKFMVDQISSTFSNVNINVHEIKNEYFGEMVTVAGLLTGVDIISQLSGKELGENLILPISMMKSGQQLFLDDMTVGELEEKLNRRVIVSEVSGQDLIDHICMNHDMMLRDNENIEYVNVYNYKND